jgi:hypothetical protein
MEGSRGSGSEPIHQASIHPPPASNLFAVSTLLPQVSEDATVSRRTLFRAGVTVILIGLGASMPAQAAGFFDDLAGALFGRPAPRAAIFHDPLEMTVQPRRMNAPALTSRPPPPVVKLDPAKEPDWYLRDPSLRRGDIVVTAAGVMVYQGRDSDAIRQSDFATLRATKSGAKGWQRQVLAGAAGGRSFFGEAPRRGGEKLAITESKLESTR